MGKKLYHFTAREHLKSILETKELRLEGCDFVENPLRYPPDLAVVDCQYSVTERLFGSRKAEFITPETFMWQTIRN